MDAMELTRLMKELIRLLQNTPGGEKGDLDERVEKIKRELGSWFSEGYQLYQGS